MIYKRYFILTITIYFLVSAISAQNIRVANFNHLYGENQFHNTQDAFRSAILESLEKFGGSEGINSIDDLKIYLDQLTSAYANGRSSMIRGRFAGLFVVVYQVITNRAQNSYKDGSSHYENPALARKIALEFGKLFIKNVERYYRSQEVQQHWKPYFEAVDNPNSHPLLILGKGINAHLNYDLTEALVTAGADKASYQDFLQSGEDFLECVPELSERLKVVYDVDVEVTNDFFKAFFLGKAIDQISSQDDVFSRQIFQSLRIMAFRNARLKMRLQAGADFMNSVSLKALERGRSDFVKLADAALDTWVAQMLLKSCDYSPIEAHCQATRDLGRILGIAFNALFQTGSQSLIGIIEGLHNRCRLRSGSSSFDDSSMGSCEL